MTRRTLPPSPTMLKVVLSHWGGNPALRLDKFIGICSQPFLDRWNTRARVEVVDRVITRPMVQSMMTLLNLPLAQDPTGNGQERRWISVYMRDCTIALRHITGCVAEENYCTLEDVHGLVSALAHRALEVSIIQCPTVVSEFLRIPHHVHFEGGSLLMDQVQRLSLVELAKLGDMIRSSVPLKRLSLDILVEQVDGAHEFFSAMAHLGELEELSLQVPLMNYVEQRDRADSLVGRKGVNCPVMQLLQNPQNRLKKLSLRKTGLKDDHLIAILHMIPSSHVEELDFSQNCIQLQGILEFANLLPRLHSLKRVSFQHNPWERPPFTDDDRNRLGTAFLQGMMENTSLVSVQYFDSTRRHDPLLLRLVAINCAGRRLVTSTTTQPIPDGLWSWVLARAARRRCYKDAHGRSSSLRHHVTERMDRVNAVYYLLQNCPKIQV